MNNRELSPDNIAQHISYWERQRAAAQHALEYADRQLRNYQALGRLANGEANLVVLEGEAQDNPQNSA